MKRRILLCSLTTLILFLCASVAYAAPAELSNDDFIVKTGSKILFNFITDDAKHTAKTLSVRTQNIGASSALSDQDLPQGKFLHRSGSARFACMPQTSALSNEASTFFNRFLQFNFSKYAVTARGIRLGSLQDSLVEQYPISASYTARDNPDLIEYTSLYETDEEGYSLVFRVNKNTKKVVSIVLFNSY